MNINIGLVHTKRCQCEYTLLEHDIIKLRKVKYI